MTFSLITFVVSLAVALAIYPPFIQLLRRRRAGQVIQAELPASHQAKAGTPIGGGILFTGLGVAGGLAAWAAGHKGAEPAITGLVAGGLLGFADDIRKLRRGSIGIPARAKLPLQVLLAIPAAYVAWRAGGSHQLPLAFDLGPLYWPLAVFAIVASANAVNLTDGMDGLAGLVAAISLAGLVLLVPGALAGEKSVGIVLAGGLVAFLVFNRYPARVFMGDTGALALGYALAAMAIQQRVLILLPLLGVVFVLETLSVMIQVAYFKASGGRRIFRMTPIHYTFHLAGWSENRIAIGFGGAGAAAALLAGWLGHRMA